jgi:hypothetical protein
MKIYFRLMKVKPYWPIIITLALVKFLLPFFLQYPVYELQRDEYLYFQQGQHPDLGYLENPPLLSWLSMVSSIMFGRTELAVHFWPSFFGALTLIITCLITSELNGKKFAQFIVGLGMLSGAFMRMHSLFQPNILDIFFWTLSLYYLIRFFKTGNKKFFYYGAVAIAFGVWSKYSIVFLIAGLFLALLQSGYRKIFTQRFTYAAIGLALLVILPNIWWQWQHNWPLIHHMQELQQTQLQFLDPGDFIKDQILYLLPVLFIWVIGLAWLFRNKPWRFLFYLYLFVILLLLLGRAKSYYSMGIYPVLIAAGAVAIEQFTEGKTWIRWSLTALIVLVAATMTPLLLPVWKPEKLATFYRNYGVDKTGLLKWEDQQNHYLPQDFADMLGWKELATKAEKFYNQLPDSIKKGTLVYCRNYGQAGALKFYGRGKDFLQRIISDNGSFLLWIPIGRRFDHLVFIGRNMPAKDDEVFQHFQSATLVDSVANSYSRQFGDKIIFFRNIDSAGFKLATDGLKEMKEVFQRSH